MILTSELGCDGSSLQKNLSAMYLRTMWHTKNGHKIHTVPYTWNKYHQEEVLPSSSLKKIYIYISLHK